MYIINCTEIHADGKTRIVRVKVWVHNLLVDHTIVGQLSTGNKFNLIFDKDFLHFLKAANSEEITSLFEINLKPINTNHRHEMVA